MPARRRAAPKVAALFAGIGGVEVGLHRAGFETGLVCEVWEPAKAVLQVRFPKAELHDDVQTLDSMPADTAILTAGFPCTDLSQAGRTAGITGKASGLVAHVFRLLEQHSPKWLVLENVRNMLVLNDGHAMTYLVTSLERLGYDWAYRLVDSRFTGVPQRRQRVILVASQTEDPRRVLLVDNAGEPDDDYYADDAHGFYWTEGLRGLGWAKDAVPTLKGGSTIGIPSPPGVWLPSQPLGRRLLTPTIEDAEAMQGFARGWTEPASFGRRGDRWKLVGNAVTTGVATWFGGRLVDPGQYDDTEAVPLLHGQKWPTAAWGVKGQRARSSVSLWPTREPYQHLTDLLTLDDCRPLTFRGASGFYDRTARSSLRFDPAFIVDVKEHIDAVAETGARRPRPLRCC
jgi:DNA (cytosine-5)-methyltransferase 1